MGNRSITVALKREDITNLKIIMNDLKHTRGTSEALRFVIEDAFRLNPDFREVLEKAKNFSASGVVLEEADLKTKTFIVDENIFSEVYLRVKDQMGLLKPRISYVVKVCIAAARVHYEETNNPICPSKDISSEIHVDDNLPNKGDLMIAVGMLYKSTLESDKTKLRKIIEILRDAY